MLRRFVVVVLLGLLVPIFQGRANEVLDSLNANGQVYTNVTITGVSATDIFFTSSNGMGNAKLKTLDRKLQKHFHYSASKAKAAERKEVADAAQYHLQMVHDYPWPSASDTNPPVGRPGKQIWAKSFLGQRAPALYVETWLSPAPDTGGKFILYDFWDTKSPACRAEIQELNGFQREFSDKLVIIGISDETADVVRPVTDPVVQFAVGVDTQKRTKDAVGITAVPHLMLIDPQGFVRWEGFPYLQGHEFNNDVLADIIAKYGNPPP